MIRKVLTYDLQDFAQGERSWDAYQFHRKLNDAAGRAWFGACVRLNVRTFRPSLMFADWLTADLHIQLEGPEPSILDQWEQALTEALETKAAA